MKQTRVLLAKPGLDGHDKGIKLIARVLRDAGAEVIYIGMRRRADQIVAAAIQEDVDVIGVSILSGIHLSFAARIVDLMKQKGLEDVPVIMGGVIPREDVEALRKIGIAEVFPVGSRFDDIVKWISDHSGKEDN